METRLGVLEPAKPLRLTEGAWRDGWVRSIASWTLGLVGKTNSPKGEAVRLGKVWISAAG